jgi:hypothetical protein
MVDERSIRNVEIAFLICVAVGLVLAAILFRRERPKAWLGKRWTGGLAVAAGIDVMVVLGWASFPSHLAESAELARTLDHAAPVVVAMGLFSVAASVGAAIVPAPSLQSFAAAVFVSLAMTVPVHALGYAIHDVSVENLAVEDDDSLVHVGESMTLRPVLVEQRSRGMVLGIWSLGTDELRVPPAARGWTIVPHVVRAEHAGSLDAPIEVARPYVHEVRTITMEAGEDRPSPVVPLAVGNTWRYDLVSRTDRENLWKMHSEKVEGTAKIDVSVSGESRENGLHFWKLHVVYPGPGGAPNETTFDVYGWNGETRVRGSAIASKGDPLLVSGSASCEVAFLPEYVCACDAKPAFALDGPTHCRHDATSKVGTAFEAFATLLTLGLAPLTSHGTTAELEDAHGPR